MEVAFPKVLNSNMENKVLRIYLKHFDIPTYCTCEDFTKPMVDDVKNFDECLEVFQAFQCKQIPNIYKLKIQCITYITWIKQDMLKNKVVIHEYRTKN